MRIPLLDQPPLWRESRIGLELAGLLRSPVWHGEDVADGQGQPVLLISGLLAGDDSLSMMAKWLKATGHKPARAGISTNVDCSSAVIERLEQRLEGLHEKTGQKVAIVGQSRGGSFARVLAVKRPDLVSGIVTLGSPIGKRLPLHPLVRGAVFGLGLLGTVGVPNMMKRSCLWGDCCKDFWAYHRADFPAGVGFVSVYSRTDGVVRWDSCIDPASEPVEVRSSHCGMAVNAEVYRVLAASLEGLRGADELSRRRRRRRHLRVAA